jgi:NCS1 family nucleobase:cation symporter-1
VLGALGWIDGAADIKNHMLGIGVTPRQFACFMAFWLVNAHFIWHGMNSIKWMEAWSAPFLIVCGLALLAWALMRVPSAGELFAKGSSFKSSGEFWKVFVPQLTAMVGFWATLSLNIPDFTRYARDQKAQAVGQAIGLPPTMTLFCFIGIMVTSATTVIFGEEIGDPVALVGKLGSTWVIVLSLVALSVATLSTNIAANVVSPANDISNLSPRRISFRMGGMITAVIGIVMMPWYLMNNLQGYIFTWLIGYSALLGPIAGIMLADYYLLRKTRLNVEALYDERGEYSYGGSGINWRAIAALAIAVAPNVPGFVNAATGKKFFPAWCDTTYGYAWFIGLGLGLLAYCALMTGRFASQSARPGSLE